MVFEKDKTVQHVLSDRYSFACSNSAFVSYFIDLQIYRWYFNFRVDATKFIIPNNLRCTIYQTSKSTSKTVVCGVLSTTIIIHKKLRA